MPFLPARFYRPCSSRQIDLVVLHSMEAPEGGDTAEAVARYFATCRTPSSAHCCIDSDSIVDCVRPSDIAYAAPGANHNGYQIELAGYARQSRDDWLDDYSSRLLRLAAGRVADVLARNRLPAIFRTAADLRAGGERARGVTTHAAVSEAFRRSDHWDPGPGFPVDVLLDQVNDRIRPAVPARPISREDLDVLPYIAVRCPTGGRWAIETGSGGVGAFDGAPFYGSLPGLPGPPVPAAPIVDCVPYVEAGGAVAGYWLIGADGGVFPFGAARYRDSYAGHPEWGGRIRLTIAGLPRGNGYELVAREPTDPPFVFDRYAFPV